MNFPVHVCTTYIDIFEDIYIKLSLNQVKVVARIHILTHSAHSCSARTKNADGVDIKLC